MKKIILTLFALCSFSSLTRADSTGIVSGSRPNSLLQANAFPANCPNPPVPNIDNWEVFNTSRIDFRFSNETVAYLGLDVEYAVYRNPADLKEFMQVISRHIPLIFSKQQKVNERVLLETATALYNQEEEKNRLNQLSKATDPILYVHWRTQKNPRTGREILDGDVNIWFLLSDGSCYFIQNEKVRTQFLSENVSNGKLRNIFVGVKYQVGGFYHILKVNRRDLLQLTEREKQ